MVVVVGLICCGSVFFRVRYSGRENLEGRVGFLFRVCSVVFVGFFLDVCLLVCRALLGLGRSELVFIFFLCIKSFFCLT